MTILEINALGSNYFLGNVHQDTSGLPRVFRTKEASHHSADAAALDRRDDPMRL